MLLASWPAVALAASAPAWVATFPHDPGAYVGIGRADKRQHPRDYRETAQAAALAQISREISVSLRAEENLVRREDGQGWEESWRQTLRADSRNELSGYRLVDVHETAEEFWVYYALDKEEHARAQEALQSRRKAVLEVDPGTWTWDPFESGTGRVHIRLRSRADGKVWGGPLALSIRDGSVPGDSCRVETDGDGGLDLAGPFLDCGLAPGRWRVTWMEPEHTEGGASIEAHIRPGEWSLDVRAEGAEMDPWQEPVTTALTALPSPYWSIRRGEEAGTGTALVMAIRLLAAEVDSLDGLHFHTLRGTLRLPGGRSYAVIGKGGHADAKKARDRAVRDFALEVGKRLLPSGKKARPFSG